VVVICPLLASGLLLLAEQARPDKRGARQSPVGASVGLVKARNASAILHGIVTKAATGCSISASLFYLQITVQ
jgi:hypothetical protein